MHGYCIAPTDLDERDLAGREHGVPLVVGGEEAPVALAVAGVDPGELGRPERVLALKKLMAMFIDNT